MAKNMNSVSPCACFVICLTAIMNVNSSTSGTFFEEIIGEEKAKGCLENTQFTGKTSIDEEIFTCERTNLCNFIGKLKGKSKYQIIDAEELKFAGKYCSILKKANNVEKLTTVKAPIANCKEAYDLGMKHDGKIEVTLKNGVRVNVYCNMSIDGGGWTVFQRRIDNSTSFYRNWLEYEKGFGTVTRNSWLGLQAIHQLTELGSVELRIDLRDTAGNWGYAKYTDFKVSDTTGGYRLNIGAYSGNIGDSMAISNGMKFTTPDRDNDAHDTANCAAKFSGSWWFKACFKANLNGLYHNVYPEPNSRLNKMSWFTWAEDMGTITYSEMKLRNNN